MSLVHSIDNKQINTLSINLFLILFGAAVLVGIFTGFFLGRTKPIPTTQATTNTTSNDTSAKTAGVVDKSTFKDKAEGVLQEGGIDGEGSFHLVRPGGDSQNVYLTSTTVDLSKYIGKKVRVYGQTMSSQKAGWFMDVGFVELL